MAGKKREERHWDERGCRLGNLILERRRLNGGENELQQTQLYKPINWKS